MAWNPLTINAAVVLDANVAISVAAKEAATEVKAKATIAQYTNSGHAFFAPGVIISETFYALRNQMKNGILTPAEYGQAVLDFDALMRNVGPPPNGDVSLILRADQICTGYGASRSADAIYIALAEELSRVCPARLLTFDRDLVKQAARNAPTVNVHLLT